MSAAKLLLALADKPIAFHPVFARIGGSVNAGVFLSQCIYWRSQVGRAFWKTQDDWTAETCLSRKETETVRKKWRELGVLLEERKGLPAKLWFDLDLEILAGLIAKARLPERGNLMRSEGQPRLPETDKHYREYESETTSENTSKTLVRANRSSAADDSEFEAWWHEWLAIPGGQRSKGAARRAWGTARKKAGVELLTSRVRTYLNGSKANGTHPRYLKHPATWLNGECWDDDTKAWSPPEPEYGVIGMGQSW